MRIVAAALSIWAIFCVVRCEKSACDQCPNHLFACGNCVCIPQLWQCDGDEDCKDGSDEAKCEVQRTCPSGEFTCDNNRCIKKDWLCDGDNDCGDDSDELGCPPRNCTEDEFRCKNSNCVAKEWKCDKDDDCGDGTDEICPQLPCKQHEFECDNGQCTMPEWVCDNDYDCSDGSDEKNCDKGRMSCREDQFRCNRTNMCMKNHYRCDTVNDCGDWEDEIGCDSNFCHEGEFNCTSGLCINKAWRCDGEFDCEDHSDEENCEHEVKTSCKKGEFQCKTGKCIEDAWVCDGEDDCSDKSDELNCKKKECPPGQFLCDNGKCIGQQKICNGVDECHDASDEKNCNLPPACGGNNGGCEHKCTETSVGAKCTCRVGYRIQENGRSCKDVDECEFDASCSQLCYNTQGTFKCSCVKGYSLKSDGRGCKALGGEAYLIFANRVDIRRVTTDQSEYTSILKGLRDAIALDFHHEQGLVFWSDVTLDTIKRAYLNGSEVTEIIHSGLDNPGGLAVDWIHDKLFWTDAGTSCIEVSNLDGRYRKVLYWTNLEKPRAIAAYPHKGWIFWTDWGTTPKIERGSMDGEERMIIANTSLFWPNGLTVDYAAERLYWVDAKHHVIECSNLNGSHRRTVINQGLPHPFALTLFEDELYWTDWHTKSIKKANKFTGNNVETVRNRLHFPMDIHTFHPQRQPPAPNHCGSNNGGCSHLCLPNQRRYSCACPTGLHLTEDSRTCTSKINTFILFSTQTAIRRVTLDTPDLTDVVIPLSDVARSIGVEWDSQTEHIYWTDVILDVIGRAKWDGSEQEVVVGTSLESPAGLALDWVSHKLYWTDSENDRIEVSNLDGTMRRVLLWQGFDQPRDIIVEPNSGYMYWTDWGSEPKIERAGMDGSERKILFKDNITWPNGLAIDYDNDRLYWTDAHMKTIESSTLEGRDRKQVISLGLVHPFGLAIHGNLMYWTDWITESIHYANKNTGFGRGVLLSELGHLMDIHVYHQNRAEIATTCSENNGGCSHLCLIAPLPQSHTCACPTGILLKSDNKTCEAEMKHFLIFAKRTDIRKISLDVPYYADTVVPVGKLTNAIAIDVDKAEGKIYWTDTLSDSISRSNLDGSGRETVIRNGLKTADGLAVDSVGKKIYWTDAGHKRIEVATLDGQMRRVLVWEDLDLPRAIALHYNAGYMFWTDWGKNPSIQRADMDGGNRQTLISDQLVWPNGLAVDYTTSRIIWGDAKTEVIECSDLQGNYRRVLVAKVAHPYGLAVSGNWLFWTDWKALSINRANKNTGKNISVIRNNLLAVMDIHVVDMELVETYINRCGDNNGGCSHLCLPRPQGFTCSCPSGLQLLEDEKTCQDMPSNYLLFASRANIRYISMDTRDHTDVYLPINDLHNVIALDYDYKDNKVYYSDVYLDVIRRADLNGSNVETVIEKQLSTTDGLAVDWIAKNLYWTDTGRDVIEVARTDGSSRKTLISTGLDEPRAIALFPKKGLMFWTDWGIHPKIEKAYLDGSSRRVIVNDDNLGFPNGLSIDYEMKRLYWVDAKLDKIETSDLKGGNRVTLIQQVPHPFGLTVYDKYIYWTDWQTERIERADKETGGNRRLIQTDLEGLMDVHLVAPDRQTGSNDCGIQNGGCTHLCLALPTTYICECPNEPDNRPCLKFPLSDDLSGDVANIDINSGKRCSKEDIKNGLCAQHSTKKSRLNGAYIALLVVTILLLLGFLVFFIIWKRQRRRRYNVEEFRSLTYSNPNYQKTSTETINSDARSIRDWQMFRFNRSEERIMVVPAGADAKNDHPETLALVHQMETSSSPQISHHPEAQNVSRNIFRNNPRYTDTLPDVPYHPVDT